MEQNLQAYIARYKENAVFIPAEREQCEVCGVRVTVALFAFDRDTEHRELARILLEKDGLHYECEGIERPRWDFFPVTVSGRACLLFSKTLYGFTLIDPDTLTEITDFFPEKVMNGDESFIITHAQSYGKYLILDGCYWGAPYEFATLDPAQMRFVSLTEAYGILAGDHTAGVSGDSLVLKGTSLAYAPMTVTVTEREIDRLMSQYGTADF